MNDFENIVSWEVFADIPPLETADLFRIRRLGKSAFCAPDGRALFTYTGVTILGQPEAIAHLILFYGEKLYSVKICFLNTNLPAMREIFLRDCNKCAQGKSIVVATKGQNILNVVRCKK